MSACRDLGKRYGDGDTAVESLRGVTVELARASFTAIMGLSGSSSRACAQAGRVRVPILQLLPVLSAEENIVMPLRIAGEKIDRDWLERLLIRIAAITARPGSPAASGSASRSPGR